MLNRENPINSSSLIISLVALILGIVLIVFGTTIDSIIGYVVGGLVVGCGAIKLASYYFGRKRIPSSTFGDLFTSLLLIVLGVFVVLNPGSVKFTIGLVIGMLMIFTGISHLILALAIKVIDDKGSKIFLGEAILLIILGLIVAFGSVWSLIGWIMIVYAISELVGYIYYTSQNKDYSEVLVKKEKLKTMKETEAREAIIDEKTTEE